MELKCSTCKERKDEGEFLKRNQSLPYSQQNVRCCRECNRDRNKKRYHADPEVREKLRVATKAWFAVNKEKVRGYEAKFLTENPANQQARNKVNYMLRRGHWKRLPCEVCGTIDNVEAHHDSYAEAHWLTIKWLCKAHHEKWHMVLNPMKEPMLAGLDEVEAKRAIHRELVAQMYALRAQARKLKQDTDALETRIWTEVQLKADETFPAFVTHNRRSHSESKGETR